MEENRRVYPADRRSGKVLRYLLLFLSAVLILSGLVWRGEETAIEPVPQPTPISTSEAFDETPAQREITLPASTWYALQLGAFENEDAAQALCRQFARRGAAGYVWQDGRYRALAATYPSREDAQQVRLQLNRDHTVDSYLYEITLPQVQLRLRGMQGQLDILEAAFLHANDLVSGLQALSVSLDRQEQSVQEALAVMQGLKAQVETVSLRLQQRFAAPRPQTVSDLCALFDSYCAACNASLPESAVALGVRIKWETLDVLRQLQQIYDSFTST